MLNKEDQEFIKNLSHEMKTQDNRFTAQPYALVVRQEVQNLLPIEYSEGIFTLYDHGAAEEYREWDEWIDSIRPDDEDNFRDDKYKENFKEAIELGSFEEMKDSELEDFFEVSINAVKYNQEIKENSFNLFLTEKAYDEHLRVNRHNLVKPDSYGVHLFRNPEMEKLYNVIHKLADSFNE